MHSGAWSIAAALGAAGRRRGRPATGTAGDGDGRRDEQDEDARVFSGSHDGYLRASAFSGPDDRGARP